MRQALRIPTRAQWIVFALAMVGWTTFEIATDSVGAFVAAQGVRYIAFEQITVAASAIGFTASKVEPDNSGGARQATTASCRVRTAEISFTYDGTTPTTTVGQLAEAGDFLIVNGHDSIMRFKAIRTGATSGQLDCTYTQQ